MARLHAMQVFVKVAETGGFAEAARQLHMSPPAVTRAIATLEGLIGTRLLTRTTRSVKLTEPGTRYLEDCRRILAEISEAEAAAAGSYATPTGTLSITASVLFGQIYILPILMEFLDLYPAVTARALFLDRVTNIVDEGIDIAIRIGHLPDSSYAAVRVGTVRRVVCGSPAYFEEHGMPACPADLANHRIIAATSAFSALDWRFDKDEKTVVTVNPRLYCSTYEGVVAAAKQGWGLARPLSYQIGPALLAGDLQTVLADHEPNPLPVHIIHPEGRRASAKVRAFVDFTADRLRANPLIN
ncbi:DNA-binding transcriptional LysR family regulator [Novosphingobium hassiacum]|uniref:DNA-binding transcriptional LysR family regulator n=1 Tax=Novosphingobium hassiacum TaxID=173676 RepID=A0A7W6EV85_9SPHN|nr:LysR family transcriptional regulator [Novosphingobium hassiacum]MBB3859504.1 DNA-binding transcriptional LysR family regulator [Novosphingobium hassiacum]